MNQMTKPKNPISTLDNAFMKRWDNGAGWFDRSFASDDVLTADEIDAAGGIDKFVQTFNELPDGQKLLAFEKMQPQLRQRVLERVDGALAAFVRRFAMPDGHIELSGRSVSRDADFYATLRVLSPTQKRFLRSYVAPVLTNTEQIRAVAPELFDKRDWGNLVADPHNEVGRAILRMFRGRLHLEPYALVTGLSFEDLKLPEFVAVTADELFLKDLHQHLKKLNSATMTVTDLEQFYLENYGKRVARLTVEELVAAIAKPVEYEGGIFAHPGRLDKEEIVLEGVPHLSRIPATVASQGYATSASSSAMAWSITPNTPFTSAMGYDFASTFERKPPFAQVLCPLGTTIPDGKKIAVKGTLHAGGGGTFVLILGPEARRDVPQP